MNNLRFLLSLVFIFLVSANFIFAQNKPSNEGFYLFGSLASDKIMTGFFSKNGKAFENKNWCVFVGENGKVYKISLIDDSIHTLFIDGQKIADSEIWKHNAEYKPFLEKFWRNQKIEEESEAIDSQAELIEAKVETIEKEIENLDKTLEKLEKLSEKEKANLSFDRKSVNSQMQRLAEMQREQDKELEKLNELQATKQKEQESLNLMGDLKKVLSQINIDLQSLGVVKNVNNNSFKLSTLELIVNGKKISDDAYQLLKAKYIVDFKDESGFMYRWKADKI